MTEGTEETDQAAADDVDRAIVRAIGEALRHARDGAGWSRPELVRQLRTQMPVNTYACYEQGIRPVSIPRLVEICQALGVSAPQLLDRVIQRVKYNYGNSEAPGRRITLDRAVVRELRDTLTQFLDG